MKLRKKITLPLVILSILITIVFAINYYYLNHQFYEINNRRTAIGRMEYVIMNRIQEMVVDLQNGIITEDDSYSIQVADSSLSIYRMLEDLEGHYPEEAEKMIAEYTDFYAQLIAVYSQFLEVGETEGTQYLTQVDDLYYNINSVVGEEFDSINHGLDQRYDNSVQRMNYFMLFTIGLFVITVIVLSMYFIPKFIIDPLTAPIDFAQKIANGQLNIDELQIKNDDEIGDLTEALNQMYQSLRNIITNLSKSIDDLSAYSEELSAASEEGNAAIDSTMQNLENMTTHIQQISASSQQVNAIAQETNAQTDQGADNIEEAVSSINIINQSMTRTVEVIRDLNLTSEEIGQIVELITDISEQTNLLALNASIEAARAGKHGQGFAVVAEEIRKLAEETAQATEKISNLINKVQNKTELGLETVKEVDSKAQKGKEIITKTGEVFTEIQDSIQNTSATIEQTSAGTEKLANQSNQVMEKSEAVSDMSDDITLSSQQLAEMAQELQSLIQEFKC
ncbi:methyl-accepting chemotaxis protein [Natroniella sulfidigena]|uniref:methyl-accepting chemotaxis protein n=1 Tax=Natroniella sulfidigena TaxID=723921 RepID=UPI00200A30C9|nr:HAMP domain-containing methyl-accepting chemotaxis protein [Natroniella sulfidigena]MCK8816944.1 methyl-accepting chemotaxis protein [Natroniella sulfidigena]